MSIYITSESKIFIGSAKTQKTSDWVAGDFEGESWTEIAWVENIGQFGDESSEVTFDAIGEGRTIKLKGTRNAGTLALTVGFDPEDAGQIALVAAEKTPDDYAFRIDFNDAPVGGTPSQRFFIAKVMSAREQLDGANSVIKIMGNLGINSNVVAVVASAP